MVPGDPVVAAESTTELGINLGVGVTFEVGLSSELYLELRYHRIDTPEATELLPFIIGYRW
jgi:hypothetical protein